MADSGFTDTKSTDLLVSDYGIDSLSSEIKRKMIYHCIGFQIIFSLIFWVWAMINTLVRDQGFDIGIATFPIPVIGGIFGLLSVYSRTSINNKLKLMIFHFIFMLCGNTALLIEYTMGAFDYWGTDESTEYMIYCCIFAWLYAIALILFTYWSWQWRKVLLQSD